MLAGAKSSKTSLEGLERANTKKETEDAVGWRRDRILDERRLYDNTCASRRSLDNEQVAMMSRQARGSGPGGTGRFLLLFEEFNENLYLGNEVVVTC